MYFVYIIKNSYGKLYTGVTKNPTRRLATHNARRGASFTKRSPTYKIVFLEDYKTLQDARKREVQIKKWRREKKESLARRYHLGLSTKL